MRYPGTPYDIIYTIIIILNSLRSAYFISITISQFLNKFMYEQHKSSKIKPSWVAFISNTAKLIHVLAGYPCRFTTSP